MRMHTAMLHVVITTAHAAKCLVQHRRSVFDLLSANRPCLTTRVTAAEDESIELSGRPSTFHSLDRFLIVLSEAEPVERTFRCPPRARIQWTAGISLEDNLHARNGGHSVRLGLQSNIDTGNSPAMLRREVTPF